jgi:hypothetical protein
VQESEDADALLAEVLRQLPRAVSRHGNAGEAGCARNYPLGQCAAPA